MERVNFSFCDRKYQTKLLFFVVSRDDQIILVSNICLRIRINNDVCIRSFYILKRRANSNTLFCLYVWLDSLKNRPHVVFDTNTHKDSFFDHVVNIAIAIVSPAAEPTRPLGIGRDRFQLRTERIFNLRQRHSNANRPQTIKAQNLIGSVCRRSHEDRKKIRRW